MFAKTVFARVRYNIHDASGIVRTFNSFRLKSLPIFSYHNAYFQHSARPNLRSLREEGRAYVSAAEPRIRRYTVALHHNW